MNYEIVCKTNSLFSGLASITSFLFSNASFWSFQNGQKFTTVASGNSGFVCQPQMSTIKRESTISREIQAKTDNRSTEHIHYNKRFHYYEIHYYQRRLYFSLHVYKLELYPWTYLEKILSLIIICFKRPIDKI